MSYTLNAYEQFLIGDVSAEDEPAFPTGPWPYNEQGQVKSEYDLSELVYRANSVLFDMLSSGLQAQDNENWASAKAANLSTPQLRELWRATAQGKLDGSPAVFFADSEMIENFVIAVGDQARNIMSASSMAHSAVASEIAKYITQGNQPPRNVLIGLAVYSETWAKFMSGSAELVGEFKAGYSSAMSELSKLVTSIKVLSSALGISYEAELESMRRTIAALSALIEQLVKEKEVLRDRIRQLESESWYENLKDMLKNAKLPPMDEFGKQFEKFVKYGLYALGGLFALKVLAFLR